MKKLIPMVAVLALLSGCATMTSTAGRVLATTAVAVDGAMQGWAMWVAEGQASAAQEAQVRGAYVKYQASMKVALSAYRTMTLNGEKAGWDQVAAVLEANQAALIGLTKSFMTGGAL